MEIKECADARGGSPYYQDQKLPLSPAEQYMMKIMDPEHPFPDVLNRVIRFASFTSPPQVQRLFSRRPGEYLTVLEAGLAEVNFRTESALYELDTNAHTAPVAEEDVMAKYQDVLAANNYTIPPSHMDTIVHRMMDEDALAFVTQSFIEAAYTIRDHGLHLPFRGHTIIKQFATFYELFPHIKKRVEVPDYDDLFAVVAPALDRVVGDLDGFDASEENSAGQIVEANERVLGEEIVPYLKTYRNLQQIYNKPDSIQKPPGVSKLRRASATVLPSPYNLKLFRDRPHIDKPGAGTYPGKLRNPTVRVLLFGYFARPNSSTPDISAKP